VACLQPHDGRDGSAAIPDDVELTPLLHPFLLQSFCCGELQSVLPAAPECKHARIQAAARRAARRARRARPDKWPLHATVRERKKLQILNLLPIRARPSPGKCMKNDIEVPKPKPAAARRSPAASRERRDL